ncbi:MAG TPA: TonB-dependent receptor [Polyangiales bacterium]|nr:TonB-dependent receptor [Polyangiales bacterium]
MNARKLTAAEMRETPGAFGDPFRVLDTLPGVVPVLSGLPYVYVRGAPPASTIYVYDDITIPALFHLGLLNAVIHPRMLGDLEFYPSVAPARYGRKTGGVFGAQGPPASDGLFHGEAELRVIDAALMLDIPIGDGGRLMVAGRYGWPGPFVRLVEPDAQLQYWDYQVRSDIPIGAHDKFQLTWFGAYDLFGANESIARATFHRAELRLLRDLPGLQFGAALQLGYDRASATDEIAIDGVRFGPRLWLQAELDPKLSLRVGADMLATLGSIDVKQDDVPDVIVGRPEGAAEPTMPTMPMRPMSSPMKEEGNGLPISGDGANDGESQQAKSRNMAGLYAELNWRPITELEFALGARADMWVTGPAAAAAAEPRAIVTWHVTPEHALHVGGGLSYQPAVFPVPVPGLADIVLDRGLQRAIQTEIGYRYELSDEWRFETSLFYNRMTDLLFLDVLLDCQGTFGPWCDEGVPRASADAYGWEVFLLRPASHALSGWLSYTLGRGTATAPGGMRFTPDFDVRHVANLVLQYDFGGGWKVGTRVLYRSGKMAALTTLDVDVLGGADLPDIVTGAPLPFVRYERRLPGFFRLDFLVAYRWQTGWGSMRVALEWLNTTFSREAIGLRPCERITFPAKPEDFACGVEYSPRIFVPNLGLRADF